MPIRKTNELFISDAKKVHGDKYDYTKVSYTNSRTPVIIACKQHGEFEQWPQHHIIGKSGCPSCSAIKGGGKRKLNKQEFVAKSRLKHGDTYDYTKAVYVDYTTRLTIMCSNHGEFSQTPKQHLSGHGCKKCKDKETAERRRTTTKEFITKANAVHDNFYTYEQCVYTSRRAGAPKVTITCPLHGQFQQNVGDHLSGHGCPKCGISGLYSESYFNKFPQSKTLQGMLYLMEIENQNEKMLKVGVTKSSPNIRKTHISGYIVNTIKCIEMPLYDAFKLEQELLQMFEQYQHIPGDRFGGHTECLSYTARDVIVTVFDTIEQHASKQHQII